MKFNIAILLAASAFVAQAIPAPMPAVDEAFNDLHNIDDPVALETHVAEIEALAAIALAQEAPEIQYDPEVEETETTLDKRALSVKASTDKYLFKTKLGAFITARKKKADKRLNWTSDGCSKSPDKPAGFNFLPRCQRHDFGYRNYKNQKRFTNANRLKIDKKFKSDLYDLCNTYGIIKKTACKKLADTYYSMVRKFGNL